MRFTDKNSLPRNKEDMNSDGTRFTFLHQYKGSWSEKPAAALRAWGANPDTAYVFEMAPDYDNILRGTRHLMAQFDDGLWRVCSFGSSAGGTPTAHCSPETYEGETGEIAYCNRMMLLCDMRCADALAIIRGKQFEKMRWSDIRAAAKAKLTALKK